MSETAKRGDVPPAGFENVRRVRESHRAIMKAAARNGRPCPGDSLFLVSTLSCLKNLPNLAVHLGILPMDMRILEMNQFGFGPRF